MKNVSIALVLMLSLAAFIGCSNNSPTGPGLQADITQGSLQEHPNLPNQTLTNDDMDEFLGKIFGDSFSLDDLSGFSDIPILQKRLAKKAVSSISFDTTIVFDTTIDGTSGSARVNATIKGKATGTAEEMTNATISLNNMSIVFNDFSMNDSIFLGGQVVAAANFSMTETSMTGSLNAKAGILFNGLYKGQLTMELSASISGNPNSETEPSITGNLSMTVTSGGSSFTYSQDLSELQDIL